MKAPEVNPFKRYLENNRAIITGGMDVITEPVNISAIRVCPETWPYPTILTGNVWVVLSEKTSAKRSSFHAPVNAKIPTVNRPGRERGKIIRVIIVK